jgi:hypothetical protein
LFGQLSEQKIWPTLPQIGRIVKSIWIAKAFEIFEIGKAESKKIKAKN